MSAAALRELPYASFLDMDGAQSPAASSGSEGEDGSDGSPRLGRGVEFRRLGLVGGALAGVVLLVLAATGAAEAFRVQGAPFALDSERAALFASHGRGSLQRGHRHGQSRLHKAYDGLATPVQTTPEQPAVCNGTALVKGRQGCCAGRVFDLMTSSCCGTVVFYFTSLSCCDHGDGTASLYEPYAQNCCDDAAVSNVQRGICKLEQGERSCCTRGGGGRRRRRHRRASPHRLRAARAESRVLSEARALGGEDGAADQNEEEAD
eukprot:CAMPEP_0198494112 /NCGR_PEP_ID=MMETSP1462-20131121/4452_1 /TAXON_ID=1333877 /ORGANISM="Brandtodinium nutriculum, Strain RCC3387" /LENGTH=262 /DNA_ID=CAMNT_0044222841 /DNA_START=77 /DNA_END=865 /DNA_ORIENTATION=-